jgi:aminoglycoside phosphotransferase (APT) family kinase protein
LLHLDSLADVSAWFSFRLPEVDASVRVVAATSVMRATRGVSRQTWLVDAQVERAEGSSTEGFVVRRDHERGTVDPVSLRTEFEVYRRLARSAVPVAVALWYEDDEDWQPDRRPAYVRTRVEGDWRLPFLDSSDPVDDEARIEACKEHLDKLALVHTSDWAALGFGEIFPVPAGPGDCAQNLIRLFARRLQEVQLEPSPIVEEGIRWLRRKAPEAPCITLCKGTNGHGEEVWRDGRIVAMSDWELACLAEPAYDLAQTQEMVPAIERDGRTLWGWPDALRHYESQTGIPVTMERVEYYRNLYALPQVTYCQNAARHIVSDGNRSARFAWTATAVQHQAELRFAAAAGLPTAPRAS